MNTPITEIIEMLKLLSELHNQHKLMGELLKKCEEGVQDMMRELKS